MSILNWSATSADNDDADLANGIDWREGQLAATVNNSARSLMAAVYKYIRDTSGDLTSTGSANAYVLTTAQTITSYAEPLVLAFKANFTCTGAATLNVDGLGAKDIRRSDGTATQADDIVSGGAYLVVYSAAADKFIGIGLGGAGAGDAASVTFTPAGSIAATDVQAAIEELDTEKQPLDSDLTSIAGLTTTAAGRSVLTIADPNADRMVAWDDTAGGMAAIALADLTDEGSPATGDYVLIYGAEGDLRKTNWSNLPGAGGGLANVSEDTSPSLGGALDADGFDINDGGVIFLREQAAAEADVAGQGQWWVQTATPNLPMFTDDAGTDFQLATVSGVAAAYQPLDSDLTSWAGVTRAAGFDTFAATPSSANLASLVTGETGSGALVFGTSPGFTTAANPVSNDGAALGTTALGWSDIHLATGAVINWANGEVTLTESDANTLTMAGGTLVLPASGLQVGSSNPFSDAAGTLTLQNVDALDATTESTIEAAIDTLANLTSIQGRTVTLADAGADALLAWDDSASAYQNLSAADARAALGLATTDNPQFATIELGHASANTLSASGGVLSIESKVVRTAGKETVWVPAGSMVPKATNGAAANTYDSGSNDLTIYTLDFDTTTQEYAQFSVAMPKGWNESTVTFVPYWTNTGGASTETVVWSLAGQAISDDDTLNSTFGTVQTSSDTWLAQNDLHIGPESSAITIGGTPAENDLVVFEVSRVVGSDNMAGDARLIGIKLFITYNAENDA